jgi:hypothetical protein
MSVDDLLDVMGCFRRQGAIMSPGAAQTMLDDSFGIDLFESTNLGTGRKVIGERVRVRMRERGAGHPGRLEQVLRDVGGVRRDGGEVPLLVLGGGGECGVGGDGAVYYRQQDTADAEVHVLAPVGTPATSPSSLGEPAGLYNKNGLWQSGAGQTEQSLAYFLPRDMELVVLANSPDRQSRPVLPRRRHQHLGVNAEVGDRDPGPL